MLSKAGARLSVDSSPMPILRITSAVERYRYFASPEFNIHALSGHGEDGLPNIQFVSARILSAIQPEARDVVLDVGCGDGYLLSQAAKTGAKCIGVVPTREEQEKLQAAARHYLPSRIGAGPSARFRLRFQDRLQQRAPSARK